MSFLLIAQRPETLPFTVSIDEQTFESAIKTAEEIESERYLYPMFLVDLDGAEVRRIVRDGESLALSDTAFEELGVATPDEWFEGEQVSTMEAEQSMQDEKLDKGMGR